MYKEESNVCRKYKKQHVWLPPSWLLPVFKYFCHTELFPLCARRCVSWRGDVRIMCELTSFNNMFSHPWWNRFRRHKRFMLVWVFVFFSLTYSHVQLFFSLRRDVAPVQKEASLFPRRTRGLKVGFYESFPARCLSHFFFFFLPSSAH